MPVEMLCSRPHCNNYCVRNRRRNAVCISCRMDTMRAYAKKYKANRKKKKEQTITHKSDFGVWTPTPD